MEKAERELLGRTLCKGATSDELDLFVAAIERTGLDPHARQIYWIKRGGRGTIQVSIDGQRSIAERTGEMDGLETHWCGADGEWVDVWLKKSPPAAARVRVYRKGCQHPFTGIATWAAYAGSSPIWQRMGDLMIQKCANSLALRSAFPLLLSGLYTTEEMDQAETPSAPLSSVAKVDPDAEARYQAYLTSCETAATTGSLDALSQAARQGTTDEQLRLLKESWGGLKAHAEAVEA
jgi:phage recombination protein Bet